MRNKMTRIRLMTLALVLCLWALTACGQSGGSGGKLPVPSLPVVTAPAEETAALKPATVKNLPEKAAPSGKILRGDGEGLVELAIENGAASISFDLRRWDELYGILEPSQAFGYEGYMDPANFREGPFPLKGLSGRVKDALIVPIEELNWAYSPGYVTPTVFLLMEDGSVEWLLADPYETMSAYEENLWFEPFSSYGKIPFVENITGLSYESDGEGMGGLSAFATDAEGLRYNLRLPCNITTIFDDVWTCELKPADEYGGKPLYGYLRFYPEGSIQYDLVLGGYSTGELLESWSGSYEAVLAEEQSYPPGTFVFDMELSGGSAGGAAGKGSRLEASYRFGAYAGGSLELYLNSGDVLYSERDEPDLYYFWLGDFGDWTADFYGVTSDTSTLPEAELIDWLTSRIEDAYEMVYRYGMTALVTGELTYFDNGDTGRDIWLGTNSEGKFTREILYSIGRDGTIYEYDALWDSWTVHSYENWSGGYTAYSFLGYVKLDKQAGGSKMRLLVDEVQWVDDYSTPNGYRIVNEFEDWVSYELADWCGIYLWGYDLEYGMSLEYEDLEGFVTELEYGWRAGVLLAEITIADGVIESILELYVP